MTCTWKENIRARGGLSPFKSSTIIDCQNIPCQNPLHDVYKISSCIQSSPAIHSSPGLLASLAHFIKKNWLDQATGSFGVTGRLPKAFQLTAILDQRNLPKMNVQIFIHARQCWQYGTIWLNGFVGHRSTIEHVEFVTT